MKITWENIENLRYYRKGYWKDLITNNRYTYIDSCETCREPFLAPRNSCGRFCSLKCKRFSDESKAKISYGNKGKIRSEETKIRMGLAQKGLKKIRTKPTSKETKVKMSIAQKGKFVSRETRKKLSEIMIGKFREENHPNWKNGVSKRNLAWFNTYSSQISFCEEIRENPKEKNILQVRCANCKKWYTPTRTSVENRLRSINGTTTSENHFYCSVKCKKSCSIFNQKKYPKGFRLNENERPDQHDWSEMVKERDGYKCTKCGSTENLIAHHKEGIRWNPIESADVDMGITLCKECERKVHSIEGCKLSDMQCK